MYGLSVTHKTINWISFALIMISLLPIFMMGRERGQKYGHLYKTALCSGLLLIIILNEILIYRFSQRLEDIQRNALISLTNIQAIIPD